MACDPASADRWDSVADSYGTSSVVAQLAAGLVDLVGVSANDSVIDVGTGTGLALRAASASGGGFAVGVDRSLGMLQVAENARPRLGNVCFVRADANELPAPSEHFDVLLAASVWQFVGYSTETLGEWRRVLRPGGRLGLSVPAPGSGASIPGDLMTKYFPYLAAEAQEDFRFRSSKSRPLPDLEKAMTAAGFADTMVVERRWDNILPSPEDWWAIQWTHGVRFFLDGLPPEPLAMLKEEAMRQLEHTDAGEVKVATTVRYCISYRR